MAEERKVKIHLKHTTGIRGVPGLYGPGDVMVPESWAKRIGATPIGEEEESSEFNVNSATKAELAAKAEELELEVERADGEEGDPLVEDYRRVLREALG